MFSRKKSIIRKKQISKANDYFSDCNHVIIGYDGSGDFLLKIMDRSSCHQYAIMHGKMETMDLIGLLQQALEDFESQVNDINRRGSSDG